MSDLYTSFGFDRKASFCLRLAATRHVSQNNPNPDWHQCYNLMLQATSGFKLSLDPVDIPPGNCTIITSIYILSVTNNNSYKLFYLVVFILFIFVFLFQCCLIVYKFFFVDGQRGFPIIQIQVINELVAAANRMGNPALATRHITFLLQTMYNHLTLNERKEIALQLQNVSQQCEGAPVPLVCKRNDLFISVDLQSLRIVNATIITSCHRDALYCNSIFFIQVLDSGTVIPPANLLNIPKTKSFTLKNMQPHLQPHKIGKVKEDHGPFLFTPINFGSLERKNTFKSKVGMCLFK